MPKIKKTNDDRYIESKQRTTSGLTIAGGSITANDLDEVSWEDLRKDYSNMMKDTPAIASSLNLLFYPVEASKFRIDVGESKSEKAKEAAEYINYCWNNIKKGFTYNLRHKLLALPVGMSIHEKVIKNGDEYKFLKDNSFKKKLTNRIIKYAPIQHETIHKFHFDDGDFKGITHRKRMNDKEGSYTEKLVEIYEGQEGIKNINDIFSIYTYRELFDDIRGNSILRPARLYWTCLKKIVIGRTINIQRGAGLVGFGFNSKPSSADITKIETLGRNLNALNADNFYWYDKSQVDIILNELKGQNEVMAFVEFLYKQILLTLLTEFISIGLGQVGAYNAGETQKSPYEMSINNLIEDLKRHYQQETDYMIDISYLSGLSKEDRPVFEFNAPNQIDLIKISQTIMNLKNAGMMFSNEDMNIIKGLLPFLPEKQITVQEQTTLEPDGVEDNKGNVETRIENIEALEMKGQKVIITKKEREIKPEILEFESVTFEKNSAEEHYLTIEEKANNLILKTIKEILIELKSQMKAGAQRAHIDNLFARELENKLMELFENGYKRGETDVKKEIKKVQIYKQLKIKNELLELALTEKKTNKQSKIISLTVSALFSKIKNTIEYDMNSFSDKQLKNIGGVDGYFDGLETQFDGVKRDLINDVTSGYTVGRNDKIDEISTDDTEFLCSEILDKNLCNKCSQDDGLTFTRKEIEGSNYLSLTGSSIHLNCEGLKGRNKCRGQWVIYG